MNQIGELIDRLVSEGAVGCVEVAARAATVRGGKPIHPSTISRACKHGVRGANGRRVRLEHYTVAGRIITSWPAYLRLLAAVQSNASDTTLTTAPRQGVAGG